MTHRWILGIILFWLVALPLPSKTHDYYFSVSEVEFNDSSMRFELVINLFSDDFSVSLDKQFSIKSEIGTSKEIFEANRYVFQYILTNFGIQALGKKLDLEFVALEADLNQATIFLQTAPVASRPKKVKFFNQLLVQEYPLQSNIIHLLSNGIGMTGVTNESERFTEIELIQN